MSKFVPYLAEEAIERDAEALLSEFAHARGLAIEPPVPIEDIVEKHLKLGIEFDDTHRLFGVPRSGLNRGQGPDILGAIFFDNQSIVIDESLDPEENASMEGRFRFTLAHEGGGHWRLHRHLFAKDKAQAAMFDDLEEPSFVCRSSEAKERVEWQADFYASCLLIPRSLVYRIWNRRFGSLNPLISGTMKINPPAGSRPRRIGDVFHHTEYDDFADGWAHYFAPFFTVSRQAMRIRLEKLGLLLSQPPRQGSMATGI